MMHSASSSGSCCTVNCPNIFNRLFTFSIFSGTNNARLAAMLRQLAQYHAKDPNNLFMVRLAQVGGNTKALCTSHVWTFGKVRVCIKLLLTLLFVSTQGLTHLGKGTLTLCPYHSDRQLMSQVAVAGLLTVLVSFLDVKNSQLFFLPLPLPQLCFHTHLTLFFCVFNNIKVVFRQWFLLIDCLLCVCCVLYSNPGEISLHSLRPGRSHAATYARHLRWGAATTSCVCQSWTGESFQISVVQLV